MSNTDRFKGSTCEDARALTRPTSRKGAREALIIRVRANLSMYSAQCMHWVYRETVRVACSRARAVRHGAGQRQTRTVAGRSRGLSLGSAHSIPKRKSGPHNLSKFGCAVTVRWWALPVMGRPTPTPRKFCNGSKVVACRGGEHSRGSSRRSPRLVLQEAS